MKAAQLLRGIILAYPMVCVPLNAIQPVQAKVLRDRIEPGREPGVSPKRADGAPSAQEDLLSHLSGQVVVPHDPQAEVEDVSLVPLDQILEGPSVPQGGLPGQLFIGDWHRYWFLSTHFPIVYCLRQRWSISCFAPCHSHYTPALFVLSFTL